MARRLITCMYVLRIRVAVFVTFVALLAPWVVPCLSPAPGSHTAMPCCHRTDPAGPAARPCCTPEGQQPAVPTAQTAAAVHVQPVPVHLPAVLTTIAQPLPAMSQPNTSTRSRSSSAVLLI